MACLVLGEALVFSPVCASLAFKGVALSCGALATPVGLDAAATAEAPGALVEVAALEETAKTAKVEKVAMVNKVVMFFMIGPFRFFVHSSYRECLYNGYAFETVDLNI